MNKLANIFLAIVLTAGLFSIVRMGAFPRLEDGNNFPAFLFNQHLYPNGESMVPPDWQGRYVSCWISSGWTRFWNVKTMPQMANAFAAYHCLWFLGSLLLIVGFVKNAALPMLGIFASVVCSAPGYFTPYLLPWDMPTMFFSCACFLAYHHRKWFALFWLIAAGALFKETILVFSLLFLGAPWLMATRCMAIMAISATQILNHLLYPPAHPAWFSLFHSVHLIDVWHLWPVVFACVGIVGLLPVALWQRGDFWLAAFVAIYALFQCFNFMAHGVYFEWRAWLELAPVGWLLASDTIFLRRALPCS